MQPLLISHLSAVNSLGAGTAAIADALIERRSGLAPCTFETVALDTYAGEVKGLEKLRFATGLAPYDCRNNRLAQPGLELDGFADAVALRETSTAPARIGVFIGTSTSGILETELAFRRRDPATGALPRDFRYTETHNTYSLADFVRRYLGLAGPPFVVSSACSSTAKVFGNARAHDRRRRLRCRGGRRRGLAVPHDALRLSLAGADFAPPVPAVRPRARRHLDRRRRGLRAAREAACRGERRRHALCSASAKAATRTTCRRRTRRARARSSPCSARWTRRGLAPADIDYINLHGTATPPNDAAEDTAVSSCSARDTPVQLDQGRTGHLLGAAGITEAIISMLAMRHGLMPGSAHTRNVDPALNSNYLLETAAARACGAC